MCVEQHTPIDFISYNVYSDEPEFHVRAGRAAKELVLEAQLPLEIYVTEFNVSLGNCIEERAYSAQRAVSLAQSIYALAREDTVTGTFQYHAYDMYCDPREFRPFYARTRYMAKHWNDEPHRLGLLDEAGRARPQYYLYKELYELGDEQVKVCCEVPDLQMEASRDKEKCRSASFLPGMKIASSIFTLANCQRALSA